MDAKKEDVDKEEPVATSQDEPEQELDEDELARAHAAAMRAHREEVQGGPHIDREIHKDLPLTRVFYPLFGLTIAAYFVYRHGANSGNVELENFAAIAATVLFLASFVVWFYSRHQAKKLTDVKYADQRAAAEAAAEAREAQRKAEKAAAKAAKKARRKRKK